MGAAIAGVLYFAYGKILGHRTHGKQPLLRSLWDSVSYLCFLLWEILKAGFVVMKLIYTTGKNTQPALVYFRAGLKSEEARTVLADSITLTAGTITVSVEEDEFCVHMLDRSLGAGIENCAFVKRLRKMER